MKDLRPNGITSIKVIQVIETRAEIGTGAEGDPIRIATQYWSLDGKLITVIDQPTYSKELLPFGS